MHSSDFCRRGPLLDCWLRIEYVQLSRGRASGLCGGEGRARGALHKDQRECLMTEPRRCAEAADTYANGFDACGTRAEASY